MKIYIYSGRGSYRFTARSDAQAIRFVESEIAVLRLRGFIALFNVTDDRFVCEFNS